MRLTVRAGDQRAEVTGPVPETARSRPLTREDLIARLQKTGGTAYRCRRTEAEVEEGLALSASAVNALRRDALAAQGIALFILSNSRKPGRAQNFAQALGVPFQGRSGKPRRRGYLQAMERMGCTPAQTVMVGDQIFTDTLGANNAGVTPLLVEPIQLAGNPGRYLRYAAETPFRLLGKRRPFL